MCSLDLLASIQQVFFKYKKPLFLFANNDKTTGYHLI